MADAGGDKRKGQGGGGRDKGDKGKKPKWTPGGLPSGAALPHGSQGVLITCDTLKDRNTARDILTLLNEARYHACLDSGTLRASAAFQLQEELAWDETEAKQEEAAEAAGSSIEKLLASEVADLKDPKQQRFDVLSLGQKSLTYLHRKAKEGPSLNELVKAVLVKAEKTQESRAKFCHRILPVETVCYASQEEIVKCVKPLIDRSFPSGEGVQPLTFAVQYAARCCDGLVIERTKVIDEVAKLVPAPHKVHLDNPDLTILVEIVKSACCLSVLENYYGLCKYNIRVISTPPELREPSGKGKGKGGAEGSEKKKPAAAAAEGAAATTPAAEGAGAAAAAAAPAAGAAAAAAEEPKAEQAAGEDKA